MGSLASFGPPDIRPRQFATTHWSLVLHAGLNDTPDAHAALERLCRTYWYPLYAHVRRRGYDVHQAQDLTQGFFARLLARQTLGLADPARGRFRSFILTTLDHYLADERDRTRARKRGGGTEILSLDWVSAEARYGGEPADTAAPDRVFDRRWAVALLDAVLRQVEEEYRRAGKGALFSALRQTLAGPSEAQPYAGLAAQLGLGESAVRVAAHRLRKLYRRRLREEIAQTVGSPQEIDEEMRHLFRTLTGE